LPLPWRKESWQHADTNSNATGFVEIVGGLYGNLHAVLRKSAACDITLDEVRRQIYVMEEAPATHTTATVTTSDAERFRNCH